MQMHMKKNPFFCKRYVIFLSYINANILFTTVTDVMEKTTLRRHKSAECVR